MASNNSALIERILSSIFYKLSMGKAGRLMSNPAGLLKLLKDVLNKANRSNDGKGPLQSLGKTFMSLLSLVKSYATGQYRDVSKTSMLAIVGALIYFVSPVDLIPDFIPMLGFADDLALLSFVLSRIGDELEKFELWQMNKDLNV